MIKINPWVITDPALSAIEKTADARFDAVEKELQALEYDWYEHYFGDLKYSRLLGIILALTGHEVYWYLEDWSSIRIIEPGPGPVPIY